MTRSESDASAPEDDLATRPLAQAGLVGELAAIDELHRLSTRVLTEPELQPALEDILAATVALQGADYGYLHLYDPAGKRLKLVARHGDDPAFASGLAHGDASGSTTGARALQSRGRVIVEDLRSDAGAVDAQTRNGATRIRAQQATPLMSRRGELLGLLSTDFLRPHRAGPRELQWLDLYARMAGEAIERDRVGSSLLESSERYRQLLDSIGEGYCTIEVLFDANAKAVDYRFLEINRAFERATDIKNAVGRRMREIAPLHEEHWFYTYGKVALTGEPVRFENHAAQLHRWYDVCAFRVGEPREAKVAVLFSDITARKRMEEALRTSEERFRNYFEIGLIGMAITSVEKGCLEVNTELCRMFGYEREELLRLKWSEITHPDDLAADVAAFEQVLAGRSEGYTLDKRWIRKDGRVIDSVMSARCVRRADGSADYFVSLVLDTTERRMAERGLVQSERRFRLLAESIPHHVWVFRPGATGAGEAPQALSYWNRRLADYTGLSDAQLQSGGWQALHPDDVERVTAAWRHAYETVSQYQVEQRIRGADGRYRRFVCRALPAVADNGGAVEWFGTNTDVEDMRQAAEALRRSQAELAHVARTTTLGELAASIAHEVNQPLTAVVANGGACIRWLAAEPPNLGEALDAVGRIVNDANRAAAIIRRIREFLRRGKEELVPIDLGTSVADALALIHSQIRERNVALRVVVADGLPPVLSDRVQVQQVVVNLAMNAIEAMAAVTDRERTLEVRTERHGDRLLCVSIRDSGVGFAAATRSRMFEAFHTTKAGGMGMGLTISRTIVEAHGGLLWAEANADHGQTFRFTLPIAAA